MRSRFAGVIRQYPKTYWSANSLELFERWAYYGIFNLLALYLTGSQDTGALGFSQVEKGLIMGIVNAILYFLPIITGSIADKFGYKKVLLIAFVILSTGYFVMGLVSSFAAIFLTFFYVAIGAALFKPIISATIAKTTNEETASIGFGIFYTVINIGGLIGPLVASELREMKWQYIFIMSSGVILVNIVILLIFYKETDKPLQAEPLGQAIKMVFVNVYRALKDIKLLLFLLIIIGGWTVYWQFFYSLPVFIDQWNDTTVITSSIGSVFPGIARAVSGEIHRPGPVLHYSFPGDHFHHRLKVQAHQHHDRWFCCQCHRPYLSLPDQQRLDTAVCHHDLCLRRNGLLAEDPRIY
jgi:POT family proton-dependent oligopeptide transporter